MPANYKAFVSSTYLDLKDHRAFVIRALRRAGIHVDPMEDWTADSDEPKNFSRQRVEGCDLCVLLVALRRGYVPHGESESITQLEYRQAVDRGIDVLPFLFDEDDPWPRRFDEMRDDPGIGQWRDELQAKHGRESFGLKPESIDVAPAISRWLQKQAPADDSSRVVPLDLAEQKTAYLDRLAHACQWIDLGGLAPQVGGELLRLAIDDIFVHLHAERDVPLADERIREEFRLRHELQREGAPAERIDDELAKLADRFAKGDQAEERVEVADALAQQRAVLLGDPGAGKTTLLRYVARKVALQNDQPDLPVGPGLLPVYVRLGEYDKYWVVSQECVAQLWPEHEQVTPDARQRRLDATPFIGYT